MATIDKHNINYLAFEGGGGKGVVYKGVVEALEHYFDPLIESAVDLSKESEGVEDSSIKIIEQDVEGPLFPIWASQAKDRPIKGVAGSSAGAITAFMLALGLSSRQMSDELEKTRISSLMGLDITISEFENFCDAADDHTYKTVGSSDTILYSAKQGLSAIAQYLARLIAFTGYGAGPLNYGWSDEIIRANITSEDFLSKKIFLSNMGWMIKKPDTTNDKLFWSGKKSNWSAFKLYGPYIKNFDDIVDYLNSIIYGRGFFSGINIRKYFSYLVEKYIFEMAKGNEYWEKFLPKTINKAGKLALKPANQITFSEFFNITGVDLVVTGVNLTQNRPLYFSVHHTPDFPVVEAVSLSMSIPFLFRPLFNAKNVGISPGVDANHHLQYYGFFVDGGTAVNYPLHAFDNVGEVDLSYRNIVDCYPVAKVKTQELEFNHKVVGFRLNKGPSGLLSGIPPLQLLPYDSLEKAKEASFPKEKDHLLGDFLENLYYSVSYFSEEGQIRTDKEKGRTILINTGDISMTDFAGPKLNIKRGQLNTAKLKGDLIEGARITTHNALRLLQ